MQWDVAIEKTIGDPSHRFRLDIAFKSDAPRLVLFGPSGAGKTLTLKAIAGVLTADAGHLVIEGHRLFDSAARIDVPARDRKLGYLFQEYALFPHLSVRQNVAFGLDPGWRNPRPHVASAVVDRWLEALELRPHQHRFPDQLSGGQRQRTALARALVGEPRALLLDEPFAALDLPLRERLRAELRELQARVAIPILLITHDPADVAAFADEIVQIAAGRTVPSPRSDRLTDAAIGPA
ncbi:MAG: ATP-binding cassette domain-containing protein [Pseudomonadota bacterium]|nr:ATP-binding cassette domain-containing protein [Pseudomonadota bacterium]